MPGAMIREILDVIMAVVTKWTIADGGVPRKLSRAVKCPTLDI
jgi:hypothetical protein